MEWSSDGYVLAVGWEHGWAIVSVGGRCLASAFGVEDAIDEERCVYLYCQYSFNSIQISGYLHGWCLTAGEYFCTPRQSV